MEREGYQPEKGSDIENVHLTDSDDPSSKWLSFLFSKTIMERELSKEKTLGQMTQASSSVPPSLPPTLERFFP
jgi:hypothetical protein